MHEQFMRLALAQAAQSGSDVPVGAVIVRDGQVIASAHNEREARIARWRTLRCWPWSAPAAPCIPGG